MYNKPLSSKIIVIDRFDGRVTDVKLTPNDIVADEFGGYMGILFVALSEHQYELVTRVEKHDKDHPSVDRLEKELRQTEFMMGALQALLDDPELDLLEQDL